MRMIDIIDKKKNGEHLLKEEIDFFVRGFTEGDIPDYQASALAMAIYFMGMDDQETAHLTTAMAKSGDMVDLSKIDGIKVDKHSTGGVADTTTLVLAPLVAACGVPVAKMSGRGLGHTGGTVDKLESIPNLQVEYGIDEFVEIVRSTNLAVVGQSGDLTPADKKLYTLRDVTATVDCIPLIASSIMSKKIASGSDALMLDVKVGSGSFMGSLENARKLAEAMVGLGKAAGRQVRALLSDMNQPLGLAVGNALEVIEAVEILRGEHAEGDLKRVALELGANMLVMAGKASNCQEAKEKLQAAIDNGTGIRKLQEMVTAQGGDATAIMNLDMLPQPRRKMVVTADQSGYVQAMDAKAIGRAAGMLGAGRERKEDVIDAAVGLVMMCRLGDAIKDGDPLCELYINEEKNVDQVVDIMKEAIRIGNEPTEVPQLIYDTLV